MWIVIALIACAWGVAATAVAIALGRSIHLAERHHDDERQWRLERRRARSRWS